jgi:hypothetical protein
LVEVELVEQHSFSNEKEKGIDRERERDDGDPKIVQGSFTL